MKKTISILLMLLTITFGAMAQESFAKQFKGKDGFSCVTIGKAAMKMMSSRGTLGRKGFSGKMNIGNFADKIDGLEIVSASTPEAAYKLIGACHDWIDKDNFESVIDVNEEGKEASIYAKTGGDHNVFLLLAQDRETSVIIIYGTMTLDEIGGIVGRGE